MDKPNNRIEDIHSAIDFLSAFKGVDSDRLGILGICGGGGYTIKAAQSDKRLKAVATLSLFDTSLVRKNGFKDSETSSIQERLQKASLARSDEVKGKIAYTGFAPKKLSDEELAKIPHDLYKEGMVYYGDTHAHPNSTFAYTTSSLMQLMSFDISSNAELINIPLLMLVGDKADTAYMSEAIFKKASGTKQKELFRLTNATHIQTYFEPRIVSEAIKKLKAFYGEYL